MRLNLDSEIGLARFGVETKHETKPNLPNSADRLHVVSSHVANSDYRSSRGSSEEAPKKH